MVAVGDRLSRHKEHSFRPGTLRDVDEEIEALQWLSVDELAAARRRAIKKLNLVDRSAADHSVTAAALERTIDLIDQVQAGRRNDC